MRPACAFGARARARGAAAKRIVVVLANDDDGVVIIVVDIVVVVVCGVSSAHACSRINSLTRASDGRNGGVTFTVTVVPVVA
jgi:hypothetical protein